MSRTSSNGPQLTLQTLQVLSALLPEGGGELCGAQIMAAAGLKSGTLYPILLRLERAGLLSSRQETDDPRTLGRPRRRYYRMTSLGVRKYGSALAGLKSETGMLRFPISMAG